jgi:hypothetical protein
MRTKQNAAFKREAEKRNKKAKQQDELIRKINAWDFVEKYYPNYYKDEQIARANDLLRLLEDDYKEGDSAHKILLTEFKYEQQTNSQGQTIEEANIHLLDEIYRTAIIGFLLQEKDERQKDRICSVFDIDADNFTEAFLFLIEGKEMWHDALPEMREHIYSVDHIQEKLQEEGTIFRLEDEATLKGIQGQLDKYDCAYFRIINNK